MALDCMIKYGFSFLIRQGHLFYGKSVASVYFFKALVEIWDRFYSNDLTFCTMSVHVLQQLSFIGADIYTHGINRQLSYDIDGFKIVEGKFIGKTVLVKAIKSVYEAPDQVF